MEVNLFFWCYFSIPGFYELVHINGECDLEPSLEKTLIGDDKIELHAVVKSEPYLVDDHYAVDTNVYIQNNLIAKVPFIIENDLKDQDPYSYLWYSGVAGTNFINSPALGEVYVFISRESDSNKHNEFYLDSNVKEECRVKFIEEEGVFAINDDGTAATSFTKENTSDAMLHINYIDLDLDVFQSDPASNTYEGIYVTCDDEPLTQGEHYSLEKGSVKITLKKERLDKLEVGTHSIKIYISLDSEATAENNDFTLNASVAINAKSTPTPAPAPAPTPIPTPSSRPEYIAPRTDVTGVN